MTPLFSILPSGSVVLGVCLYHLFFRSSPLSRSLVLTLLAIGGVERNPGPRRPTALTQLLEEFRTLHDRIDLMENRFNTFGSPTGGTPLPSHSVLSESSPHPLPSVDLSADPGRLPYSSMSLRSQHSALRSPSSALLTQPFPLTRTGGTRVARPSPERLRFSPSQHPSPRAASPSARFRLESSIPPPPVIRNNHKKSKKPPEVRPSGKVSIPQGGSAPKRGRPSAVVLPDAVASAYQEYLELPRTLRTQATYFSRLSNLYSVAARRLTFTVNLWRSHIIRTMELWTASTEAWALRTLPAPPLLSTLPLSFTPQGPPPPPPPNSMLYPPVSATTAPPVSSPPSAFSAPEEALRTIDLSADPSQFSRLDGFAVPPAPPVPPVAPPLEPLLAPPEPSPQAPSGPAPTLSTYPLFSDPSAPPANPVPPHTLSRPPHAQRRTTSRYTRALSTRPPRGRTPSVRQNSVRASALHTARQSSALQLARSSIAADPPPQSSEPPAPSSSDPVTDPFL